MILPSLDRTARDTAYLLLGFLTSIMILGGQSLALSLRLAQTRFGFLDLLGLVEANLTECLDLRIEVLD